MKQCVESGQFSHSSYLGNIIQNEFIASISGKMLETMVTEIKQSQYYLIILDCTPNLSHQVQISVIIRTVKMDKAPEIKEHVVGFLVASETTGLGLSSSILNKLMELNIPFDDCRGQSYDNRANMKGRNKEVQARLLERNPSALYIPWHMTQFPKLAGGWKSSKSFNRCHQLLKTFSPAP